MQHKSKSKDRKSKKAPKEEEQETVEAPKKKFAYDSEFAGFKT